MLWIIHLLLGMILGLSLESWFLIIPIALLSHFLLDMLPHWDGVYDKKNFLISGNFNFSKITLIVRGLDLLISIAIMYYFLSLDFNTSMLLGAIFSGIPDMMKVFYFTPIKNTKIFTSYIKFHSRIQRETSFLIGMSTQLILGIILFIFLKWLI